MDQQLYSSSLQSFSQQIDNQDLLATLTFLEEEHNNGNSLPRFEWKEDLIAVPINIQVILPPLGNFEGIDIHEQEPFLLVLSLKSYPSTAPTIHPDRIDFPKDKLAHLYLGRNGAPPPLCLVRGSLNEWYANKRIIDLITRTSNWLRDAASGNLSTDGDQFEPLRLEGYRGELIYDYDALVSIVLNSESLYSDGNFALFQFERIPDVLSWRFTKHVRSGEEKESLTQILAEAVKKEEDNTKKLLYHGYLLWSTNPDVQYNYDTALPHDWASLQAFCESYSIDINELESEIIGKKQLRPYRSVPLIIAVHRPKQVIGFSSNIELINFHVTFEEGGPSDNGIDPSTIVSYKKHAQPVTCQKAREISGTFPSWTNEVTIAGCGALGSKIALHLARSGGTDMLLFDTDKLMPHNCVRHGLGYRDVGKNKADALAEEIGKICVDHKVLGLPVSGQTWIQFLSKSTKAEWFFDFTASEPMLQELVKAGGKLHTKVCRGHISDFGELGILLFEGPERNPRLDDLLIHLYAKGIKDEDISAWLQRELATVEKSSSIMVGVGCHSETTVLADDTVSVHAGVFSALIKEETKKPCSQGLIFLNNIKRNIHFQVTTSTILCGKWDVLPTSNSSPWQIRFSNGVLDRVRQQMIVAAPKETGGVFIGSANYKTHTIHVVDIITAPPDSKASCTCFHRGIEGLRESVDGFVKRTGGLLGYIGEWHSHPDGPEGMSQTDYAAVQRFKKEYQGLTSSLPVFMMIVTPTSILPYVF